MGYGEWKGNKQISDELLDNDMSFNIIFVAQLVEIELYTIQIHQVYVRQVMVRPLMIDVRGVVPIRIEQC